MSRGYSNELGWPQETQNWLFFYLPKRSRDLLALNADKELEVLRQAVKQKKVNEKQKKESWTTIGIPSDTQNWWLESGKDNQLRKSFNLDSTLKLISALTTTSSLASRPTSAYSQARKIPN